jgi:hypothetical protein
VRSHGIAVRQMAHDHEVVCSNPGTVYWINLRDLLDNTLKTKWKIKIANFGGVGGYTFLVSLHFYKQVL